MTDVRKLASFLAIALLLTACKGDNTPDATSNTIPCKTFLKWDYTKQTEVASFQLHVNSVKDSPSNEADLTDAVIIACKGDLSQNAQEVAYSLAQDAAILQGN